MFGVALRCRPGGWASSPLAPVTAARGAPARAAPLCHGDSFDGGFNFCRLWYANGGFRREAGGQGWSTDYPDADINFSIRFGELTKARVSKQANGAPNHVVVRANDPLLYQCPFLLAADVGTMELGDDEVQGLRDYLMKGGFLWVDDFWGSRAWDEFEIADGARAAGRPYTFRDVAPPPDLPHDVRGAGAAADPVDPVLARLGRRHLGARQRQRHAAHARHRHPKGRLLVLATHNTDIADAWEREGEDPQFFYSFSPQGYARGAQRRALRDEPSAARPAPQELIAESRLGASG